MIKKSKAIVVDLDGTLCCGGQRLHLVPPPEQRGDPLAWEPFHMACIDDTVIKDVLALLVAMADGGYEIIYVSYRSESTRELTLRWLGLNGAPYNPQRLYLRPSDRDTQAGDYKVGIIQGLALQGYDVVFALDDDPEVCHALRQADIPVYQVRDWKKPMPSEQVEMPSYTPGTKAMAEKATRPLGTTMDLTIRHEKAFVVSMASVTPEGSGFSTRVLMLMMEGIGPVQEIGEGEVALDLMAAEDWLDKNIDAVCGFGGVLRENVSTLIARGIMIYPEPGQTEIEALKPGAMIYDLKSNI